MAQPGGKLVINIEEASLKRDTETFGTMDPYCKVIYNGENHKSKVKENGGKHPVWNHRLELDIHDIMDMIEFKVYDSNTFGDEQIAHTVDLKIYNCIGPNNGMTEDHHLFYEKKDRGTIKVRTQYIPNEDPNANQPDPAAQQMLEMQKQNMEMQRM